MAEVELNLNKLIIQKLWNWFDDILDHRHTHYINKGGRGGAKSSGIGIVIPVLVVLNPRIHALCMRKVGNTIQKSIRSQIEWGIYQLGLEKYFKIPKNYSNPIVYLPTGQQIIFAGLDDPGKIKSIKLPFGYIAVTWFEEFDQYSGETEIRRVLQSTMRGGDKFWNFCSFNPPISKNNWANEYTELADTRKDTLVTTSSYLDVPREWLGDAFFEEAEILKEINPRAYEHEYLGIPTGTGGDVFDNVEDLDTEQLVEIQDVNGFTIKQVPMYKTFDNVLNACDWGFAVDPFRYIKMHYNPRKLELYIFDEYTSHQMRNEEVFNDLYINLEKIRKDELLIADSAEPKSIADFRAYGAYIRGAEKGPESIRYGIKWLQGLRKIYIDKRKCPETYKEFVGYEYLTDKDGNFYSAYPDENNHCLVGDTIVNTPDGQYKIKDLVGKSGSVYSYDIENNKFVEAEFINCRMTFESAEIWEIELEDSTVIQCTYDHPILTSNRGYIIASELNSDDDIVSFY